MQTKFYFPFKAAEENILSKSTQLEARQYEMFQKRHIGSVFTDVLNEYWITDSFAIFCFAVANLLKVSW